MKTRFPDARTTRQYLLGKFANRPKLQEELDEEMLFNDELSEEVDAIEDEIIEDYLDGSLNADDRRSFEQFFLRPRVRQEKLRFARLLRQRLNPAHGTEELPSGAPAEKTDRSLAGTVTQLILHQWTVHLRTYIEFAAVVVFTVSTLLYTAGLRNKTSDAVVEVKHLEAELAHERAQSASIRAQLESLSRPPIMTLAAHRRPRLQGESPALYKSHLGRFSQSVKFNLLLKTPAASSYDVRLQSAGGTRIWSARLRPLISASEPPQIAFDMSLQDVNDGEYAFAVQPILRGGDVYYYHFAVHH